MSQRRHRRRRAAHEARRRNRSHTSGALDAFLEETPQPPEVARALRALLPEGALPDSSSVLAGRVDRMDTGGPSRLAILDALRELTAWCYQREPHRQQDLALHLVQNELQRRHGGAAAQPVTLPVPPPGARWTAEQIVALVAEWEALSYAAGLAEMDPALDPTGMMIVSRKLIMHLATVDGVPVRFDRLDPHAYCEHLESLPEAIAGLRKPADFTSMFLDATAELYAIAIERGLLDPNTGYALVAQLRVLAELSDEGAEIAAA